MNRKEITDLLGIILYHQKFSGIGKYYASEVTVDYGMKDACRVDYMQFVPPSQMSVSCLEKGIFICYEIKSCLGDFKSGHGQNYIGEENYLVMPMELYKKVIHDLPCDVGVLVPIPIRTGRKSSNIHEEFENPTKFEGNPEGWKLYKTKYPYLKNREKSITELLFCMLRSGRGYSEMERLTKLWGLEQLEERIGVPVLDLFTEILGKSIYYLDDDSCGSCRVMGIQLVTTSKSIFSFTSTVPDNFNYNVLTDSCWTFRLRDYNEVWFLDEKKAEKALEAMENEETKM